jgi:hypothetical protein
MQIPNEINAAIEELQMQGWRSYNINGQIVFPVYAPDGGLTPKCQITMVHGNFTVKFEFEFA